MTLYEKHVNPHLGTVLARLRMDKQFVHGEGLYLTDAEGTRYLDFVAAYGALPFGYNDPGIWQAMKDVQTNGEPSFSQPSALQAAGELAEALIEIMPHGMDTVTFTNSGAETAEAAIKMARSATGKMGILSAKGSFHGKTLGALSATGNSHYQEGFGVPLPGFSTVKYGDIGALNREVEARRNELAAFLIEPIQGEGGIIIPPEGYLEQAYEICSQNGVLLVVDEIQTGLGRSGKLLCGDYGSFTPDIILLAKALGGGLIPIGACVAKKDLCNEDFALKHSSTFAGNALACRVGIAAINKLKSEALLANVRDRGRQLVAGLEEIRTRYPKGIIDVRGKGLMIGIELESDPDKLPQGVLGAMAELKMLTSVVASYLLNVRKLRVAPTLNRTSTIRIEPALIVDSKQCDYALEAIEEVAYLIDRGNAASFLAPFIDIEDSSFLTASNDTPARRSAPNRTKDEGRFAFIIHLLDDQNWSSFDSSLSVIPDNSYGKLSEYVASVVDPFVVSEARIVSPTGQVASGQFICIPRTTELLLGGDESESAALVSEAVELARENGARIVGLGAYTSVVTRGGRNLRNPGVALTTGNCYTVATAVEAVFKTLEYRNRLPGDTTVCIVGATGSVGRAMSILLAEKVGRLILVGNPSTPQSATKRMLGVTADLCAHLAGKNGDVPSRSLNFPSKARTPDDFAEFARSLAAKGDFVSLTTDLESVIGTADVVVTATSSVSKLVRPEILKPGAIVCDVSVPSNVAKEEISKRPDLLVIDGGVVTLPGNPYLGWDFHLGPGEVYACMAETIMLALDHRYETVGLGIDLPLETILRMRDSARIHGVAFAGVRSMGQALTKESVTVIS